jgi:hypothetical protein
MGALVSGGVAASRLSWPRNLGRTELIPSIVASLARSNGPDLAAEAMLMGPATFSAEQVLATPFPSYHHALELARALNRSGDPERRQKALALLDGLRRRYPHVLAIGLELVLALTERHEHERAEHALKDLEHAFPNLDEESLCRWGRLFKDRGDDYDELPGALSNRFPPNLERAEEFYRRSLAKYDQAYQIRAGHYPGINKATLLLNLGSLKAQRTGQGAGSLKEVLESEELARELLENRGSWRADNPDDETTWHPATAGEAHLLCREWAEAAANYREALDGGDLNPHARESMRRKVERILAAFHTLDITSITPPFDDPAAFFEVAGPRPIRAEAAGEPSEPRPPVLRAPEAGS